jgi:hypothetical protein
VPRSQKKEQKQDRPAAAGSVVSPGALQSVQSRYNSIMKTSFEGIATAVLRQAFVECNSGAQFAGGFVKGAEFAVCVDPRDAAYEAAPFRNRRDAAPGNSKAPVPVTWKGWAPARSVGMAVKRARSDFF